MGISSATTLSLTNREVRTGAKEEGVEMSLIPSMSRVSPGKEQSFEVLLTTKNHEVVSAKLVLEFDESIWEFVDLAPSGPMDEVVEVEARKQGEAKLSLGIKPHKNGEGESYLISPVTGSVRVARLTLRARQEVQGEAEIKIKREGGDSESMALARASGLTNVLGEIRGSEVWINDKE